MSSIFGLEYALFFGVPSNKLELINGYSRWAFPFVSRDEAEAHFGQWLETLGRWKQVDKPAPIRKSEETWQAEIGGVRMELFPRPIDIRIPISGSVFEAFLHTFQRRDYWPGQPAGLETGWDSQFDESDIRTNLWRLLSEFSDRHGGQHGSRVDVALTPWASVAPDAVYYARERQNILAAGDYFDAPPDLIAEVLSAPSRMLDRGPRMEIYRRAAVPHLWLIEPAQETVEVYELHSRYELIATHHAGETFESPLFPGERVSVEALFVTQSKRSRDEDTDDEPDPIPEWIIPPDTKIGLEHFFHLGHPERRWEFWDNKARSVLAFGSATEARARLAYFLEEACRWESLPHPKVSDLTDDVQQTEAGRFQLTRRGRLVFLDVAIDGRRHEEILMRWSNRDAWDWGKESMRPP